MYRKHANFKKFKFKITIRSINDKEQITKNVVCFFDVKIKSNGGKTNE